MSDEMLFGWQSDPAGSREFVASLPSPTFTQAAPGLGASGQDVFLGDYLLQCMPSWTRLSQPIGSCVGWGSALSLDILASVEILKRGEPERFGGRTLEASVYGLSRTAARGVETNRGGDGSTGFDAAKAIRDFGCLHYGVDYDGKTYTAPSSGLSERTFGREGVPAELMHFAKEHTCREVTLVQSWPEYAAAISNGYPVFICSDRGFNMTMREGWLSPSGSWSHCMMGAGVRMDKPGGLIVNSWGDCYKGTVDPRLPVQFQRCAGWVDAQVLDQMLAQGDSYAIAGFNGFQQTNMDSWTGGIL